MILFVKKHITKWNLPLRFVCVDTSYSTKGVNGLHYEYSGNSWLVILFFFIRNKYSLHSSLILLTHIRSTVVTFTALSIGIYGDEERMVGIKYKMA